MTKEEIIEIINNIPLLLDGDKVSEEDSIKISVVLVKAVQVLKQEPCELVQKAYEDGKKDGYVQAKVEQEPCDDCISRQAVIDAIKNYASMLWERYYEPFQESTVLELIQALPSVTPKPKVDDDCISRQAVIDYVNEYTLGGWFEVESEDCIKDLKNMPSVMPKCPPQDEQNICHCVYCPIKKSEDKMLVCPNCGLDVHSDFKYCPRCGEKMIASQEKRCADCNHYGKLSLDCGRCDDDCSMFEPQESEE